MEHEIRDITILGAGPTGLFGLFYCGMRGATAQLLDALPQAGGQLTALYPEKYIFDVAGFPKILAKDLVKSLDKNGVKDPEKSDLLGALGGMKGDIVGH